VDKLSWAEEVHDIPSKEISILSSLVQESTNASTSVQDNNTGRRFLQGDSGVELKGTHTQEFMSGYINGTRIFQQNKGYAEGHSILQISSGDVKYIAGYKDGMEDRVRYANDELAPLAQFLPYKR